MDKSIIKSIRVHILYPGWEYRMKCYRQKYYNTLNESIVNELILRI